MSSFFLFIFFISAQPVSTSGGQSASTPSRPSAGGQSVSTSSGQSAATSSGQSALTSSVQSALTSRVQSTLWPASSVQSASITSVQSALTSSRITDSPAPARPDQEDVPITQADQTLQVLLLKSVSSQKNSVKMLKCTMSCNNPLWSNTTLFFIPVQSTSTSSETETSFHHEDDTSPSSRGLIISDDPAQWPDFLSHSEKCHKSYLVIRGPIQVKDIVFCFACKLFGKQDNALTKQGFRNGKNLTDHLKEHEYSKIHITNMRSWHKLQKRLKSKTTINQNNQNLLHLEAQHWRGVICRVIAIICHPTERNQGLRGHTNVLYDPQNGNFLSLVELMGLFDPVMTEHLRLIQNKETRVHCLSGTIQKLLLLDTKYLKKLSEGWKKLSTFPSKWIVLLTKVTQSNSLLFWEW